MPASEAVDGSSAGTGVPRKWALLKPYAAAKQFRFAALHESGHGPTRTPGDVRFPAAFAGTADIECAVISVAQIYENTP